MIDADDLTLEQAVALIDDCATLLLNPTWHGLVIRKKISGQAMPGQPFRDQVIARLAALSPEQRRLGTTQRNPRRGELVVPMHIVRKANAFLLHRPSQGGWPEDEWHTLTPGYDLNLYLQPDNVCVATIYSVESGHSKTGKWWEIYRTGGWRR